MLYTADVSLMSESLYGAFSWRRCSPRMPAGPWRSACCSALPR
jgi:hypothetical protein